MESLEIEIIRVCKFTKEFVKKEDRGIGENKKMVGCRHVIGKAI